VLGRLGTNPSWFDLDQLQERFIAMPTIIADWAREPEAAFNSELTAAAIIVMLVVVLVANTAAILLRNKYEKKRQG
jgi:phosphate transport system permease protein